MRIKYIPLVRSFRMAKNGECFMSDFDQRAVHGQAHRLGIKIKVEDVRLIRSGTLELAHSVLITVLDNSALKPAGKRGRPKTRPIGETKREYHRQYDAKRRGVAVCL